LEGEEKGMSAVKQASAKKTLKVTQIKSTIACPADQEKTIKALGLGKINRTVEQVDNPCVRGIIFKVKHLVKVEEI
jgi:large subunit ribosomal protein L30